MNVLLIGGNGFIGSHLTDILLKNKHEVRIFDYSFEKYREKIKEVDYRISSLNNLSDLSEALINIDIVYHLASSSLPRTSNIDTTIDINENLLPTLKLLDLMSKLNVKRIVYFSSGGAVYGTSNHSPTNENNCLRPISSYGIIKLTIENYLKLYEKMFGIQALIIRPSNPYGPRQSHLISHGVINTFLTRIKENSEIIVYGNGSAIKDYIYITDLVEACYMLSLVRNSGVYNIGYGEGTSINDIIKIIAQITKSTPQIVYKEFKEFDVQKIILDITHLKSSINWTPKVSLIEGIQKQWNWISSGSERK